MSGQIDELPEEPISGTPTSQTFIQNYQQNQTLNISQGLVFPPPEQIHVLEKYHPGFVSEAMDE